MPHAGRALALSELRERIGRLEGRGRPRKALPFGVRAVDRHLPAAGSPSTRFTRLWRPGLQASMRPRQRCSLPASWRATKDQSCGALGSAISSPRLSQPWACIPIASFMPRPTASLRFWPPPRRGFATKGSRVWSRKLRGWRAAVEHVFAHEKGPMGLVVRTIGLARARVKIGLANLVYNMKRTIWLTGRLALA